LISSAVFSLEVPGSNSPLMAQELQIGGTRQAAFQPIGFTANHLAARIMARS
jgi:hypothetical protein